MFNSCYNSSINCLLPCGSGGRVPTRRRVLVRLVAFAGGFVLGQVYYVYLLKKIPFPDRISVPLSLGISLILGIGNLVCSQLRCISLLTLPMYCGKPGRGVLKAVVLTYVIAGPIMNMGLNAKEVVRVFACSTHLAQNLSREAYTAVSRPLTSALFDMRQEVSQIKDTIRSIQDVLIPIKFEIESPNNNNPFVTQNEKNNTRIRKKLLRIDRKQVEADKYLRTYLDKLESRCQSLWSRATAFCMGVLASAPDQCPQVAHNDSSWVLSWPTELSQICDLKHILSQGVCDSWKHINPGLGEGFAQLKKATQMLTNNKDVSLQYKLNIVNQLYDIQDAKETGDRVMHAFEEKFIIMRAVTVVIDVCVALLFLRIFTAAMTYHDKYLTNIEYDNIYITSYFKRIDKRRKKRDKYTLLPLKKMERSKYVDVHSLSYKASDRDMLIPHMMKVTLEVVTATTFVMLHRLFYEALDVVRQHAEMEMTQEGTRDLEIKVEGTGPLASMLRKVLSSLNSVDKSARSVVVNKQCAPRPLLMPPLYYLMIYGGYLWILLLLCVNPYTIRLRRLVCSYFYPRREKQRILHLYNDILKKRMKMQKTLQRKAIQSVRAHYLSGENLLKLRMRFPRLLGWLRVLPAARMPCLICGETAPRDNEQCHGPEKSWHSCTMPKCPFVYCVECWREVGARCLACDPALADLSDDELSDGEQ